MNTTVSPPVHPIIMFRCGFLCAVLCKGEEGQEWVPGQSRRLGRAVSCDGSGSQDSLEGWGEAVSCDTCQIQLPADLEEMQGLGEGTIS